jgi:hypothetical protein
MSESFPEKKVVVPIERAFAIQEKERSKEEYVIMQELERLVPVLFAAENDLIITKQHVREKQPTGEKSSDDDMREQIEALIDEVAYIKAEMYELLEKMRALDEKKKELIEREAHFKDQH